MKDLKENGITLVALAVTITVMLILGTISINAMFGENGVLKKAKEQGGKTKGTISESEAKTNQLMQEYENMMAGGVGNEVDEASQDIIDNLKKQIEELQKQNDELKKGQATGDATEDQVLSGATFSTSKGVNLTGTMATLSTADWNGDKVNKQVNATSTVVGNASDNDKSTEYVYFGIEKNKYTGDNQWVRAKAADLRKTLTSSANAGAGQILSGYTAYVNGNKLTGTMANRSSTIQTATTNTSNTSASCYRVNGSNVEIVPALGYWGTWDWSKSCIKIPVSDITNLKGLKGTTGTFYIGSTGNSSSTSVNCGFQPNIILAQDQNGTGRGFIYSTYSGLNLWFDADSKMKFENRISTTSTGFKVNGELAYGENRTYKYTAIKWY